MAAAALREQLNALLSSMFSAGLVDDQFQQLQMLQDDGGTPGFVAEVVTLFCDDADRIIAELSSLLEQPVVDFDKVDAFVHQLKGSSARLVEGSLDQSAKLPIYTLYCRRYGSSPGLSFNNWCIVDLAYYPSIVVHAPRVGAQKVKFTCMQFRQFCQEKSRDGCLMALAVVRNEFYDLRNKFQTMLQLEQQIQAYDPKQQ